MELAEIKAAAVKFGIERLRQETGLSRSHMYGILNGKTEPKLSTFNKLIGVLGYRLNIEKKPSHSGSMVDSQWQDSSFLRWSLAYYGAPLLVDERYQQVPDLNGLVMQALQAGRLGGDINAVLPVFLKKNFQKINWKQVLRQSSELHYLAYQLNLVAHMTNDFEVLELLLSLKKDLLPQRLQPLVKRGRLTQFDRAKMKQVNNKIARQWKFLTADSLDGIESRFKKWTDHAENI